MLAVDHSSGISSGMKELTENPGPAPIGAYILCEVASYDRVSVETVDVGQSEYMVRDMVDETCVACSSRGMSRAI